MIDSVFGNKELDDVEKTLIGMKIADDIEKNNLEKQNVLYIYVKMRG